MGEESNVSPNNVQQHLSGIQATWVIDLSVVPVTIIKGEQTDGKMFEKPPPEYMAVSHADSRSSTVDPGCIWVAPTAVTNGHVAWSRVMCHLEWRKVGLHLQETLG
jgi:hypothetical protein